MYIYEVGKEFPGGYGHDEGVLFNMDDSGATALVFFNEPTQGELEQFGAGNPFEIRFSVLSGILIFTLKVGNLNWMDAPYSVHLSENLTKFTIPSDREGLALTLMLVDTKTGTIKSQRVMGLSTKFTKRLFGELMEQKVKPFNKQEYWDTVTEVMKKYSTKEIVKMGLEYCRFQ